MSESLSTSITFYIFGWVKCVHFDIQTRFRLFVRYMLFCSLSWWIVYGLFSFIMGLIARCKTRKGIDVPELQIDNKTDDRRDDVNDNGQPREQELEVMQYNKAVVEKSEGK